MHSDREDPAMTDNEPEPTHQLELTCGTDGCTNAGVPIVLTVPTHIAAGMCGACGNPITPNVI